MKLIETLLFNRKRNRLMKQISRLQLLMEVSKGYPQHNEYSKELDKKIAELRKIMIIDK